MMITTSKERKGSAGDTTRSDGTAQRYGVRRPPEITAEMGRRRWRELNRLVHACMVLHAAGRDRRPLQRLLHMAAGVVGASRGVFYLRDSEMKLEASASEGFPAGVPEGLRSGGEIAPAAMQAGKPLLVVRPEEAKLQVEIALLGGPACVGFPIQKEGQPWGVVVLGRALPFEEDEAILLWMFALVVEDSLSGLARGERPLRVEADSAPAGLVSPDALRKLVDFELQRLPAGGRPCTLLKVTFKPADAARQHDEPLRRAGCLRVLRSALRSVDKLAPGEAGEMFILMPSTDAREGEQAAQKIRRSLIHSRVLGEESDVIRALAVRRASCPDQGERGAALFHALESERS